MSDPIAKVESVPICFDLATVSDADFDAAIALWESAAADADYTARTIAALSAVARYGEGHEAPAYDASEA